MAKRQIRPVDNNIEKYYTYREYIKRCNTAVKEGFYFEAILIDYAMMEDRLRSMLYHMGVLTERSKTKVEGKLKPIVKTAVEKYAEKDASKSIGITAISGKMKVLQCLLKAAENETDDAYFTAVRKVLSSEDIGEITELFQKISDWCLYRNEIIHCLMNKNIDSVTLNAAEKVELGFALAREIDKWEGRIKRKNVLRKQLKLPVEIRGKVPEDGKHEA